MVIAATTLSVSLLASANTNQRIADEIGVNLRQCEKLSGQQVAIKFQDGTVWLRGSLQSEEQIAAALEAAKGTKGVNQVVSELTVQSTSSPAVQQAPAAVAPATEDASTLTRNQQIANRIAANLQNTRALSGQRVFIRCQNSAVWLKGEMAGEEQVRTAMQVAADTPGVSQVFNLMTIRPETAPAAQASAATAPADATPVTPVSTAAQKPAPTTLLNALKVTDKAGAETPVVPAQAPVASAAKAPEQTPPATTQLAVRPRPTAGNVAQQRQQPAQVAAPPRVVVVPSGPYAQQVAPQQAPRPIPVAMLQQPQPVMQAPNTPIPMYSTPVGGVAPAQYDQAYMPNYAWPSYAAYPNYAAVTYPKQYSPTAWPYIGPFYPYPQVPLGWRRVMLEWDDGWWMLDFIDKPNCSFLWDKY
jgi:osmotically-inducible protein OsmY